MTTITSVFEGENGELELSISATGDPDETIIISVGGKSVSMGFSDCIRAVEFMGNAARQINEIF